LRPGRGGLPNEKRQNGLPHSTTLARGPHTPVALAKLLECACLFWRFWFDRIGSKRKLAYIRIAIAVTRNVDSSTISV